MSNTVKQKQNAGGGSRAAKKRQKQQQKKQQQQSSNKKQKITTSAENVKPKISKQNPTTKSKTQAESIEVLGTPAELLFGEKMIGESAPDRARAVFQSLLGSKISPRTFYKEYWEKKPLHISRKSDDIEESEKYFDGILSQNDIECMMKNKELKYGVDLNVTKCTGNERNLKRITLDPVPETMKIEDAIVAKPNDVWCNFKDGCSIRLLCPHAHLRTVHALLSILESEFGCMIGANAYLTPGKISQGFAPHYDDIEAFILQLEGKKRWKVYRPLNISETLPRESSKDFDVKDLSDPIIEVTLEPGDLLYMPRGWIHQAVTTREDKASLHLTVSAMQHWSWADFLELVMPDALQAAIQSDSSTSLREGTAYVILIQLYYSCICVSKHKILNNVLSNFTLQL